MLGWSGKNQICSGCPPSPVHQKLYKDHEDTDQHSEPQEDEAPAEQGEAVGLPVLLLAWLSLTLFRPRPIPVPENYSFTLISK